MFKVQYDLDCWQLTVELRDIVEVLSYYYTYWTKHLPHAFVNNR